MLTSTQIRLLTFLLAFTVFWILESFFPLDKTHHKKTKRWVANVGIIIFNNLLVLLMPIVPFTAAIINKEFGFGLFSYTSWGIFELFFGILILDLTIYLQHVLFHKIPFLWKFHMMHHTDIDVDVSTGIRFHPIEILISVLIRVPVVILFGISGTAVLIFEILLNATSLFHHSNTKIPKWLDKLLRFVIVTPSMHRIHHSSKKSIADHNFSFSTSIWDHIFHTYKAAMRDNNYGTPWFRDEKDNTFFKLLKQPFMRKKK